MARFTRMARYSERIDTNSAAIRALAKDLRTMADDFDRQADFMDELKVGDISVTHWKTMRDAINGFASFAGAIKKSVVESKMLTTVHSMLKDPTMQTVAAQVDADGELARQRQSRNGGKKS